MRQLLCYAAAAAMVIFASTADAATTTRKKTTHKKKSAVTARKAAPGAKGTTKKATTWRNRQLSPTPERYKEIQQALVAKGYLNPDDANGTWNQASSDGLKKFQMAQNLDPNGKINSLSLIALGLGPKHETAQALTPAH